MLHPNPYKHYVSPNWGAINPLIIPNRREFMSDKRTIAIKVRVNEAERDFITRIMESAGYRSRERFIRKMILDGVIFRMNMEDV